MLNIITSRFIHHYVTVFAQPASLRHGLTSLCHGFIAQSLGVRGLQRSLKDLYKIYIKDLIKMCCEYVDKAP